jgi:hypothetical protein
MNNQNKLSQQLFHIDGTHDLIDIAAKKAASKRMHPPVG